MKLSFLVKSLAGAAAMVAMAGPALAAAQSAPSPVSLKGDVMLEKTVSENGVSKVQLVEPKVVIPGDHLLFTTRYRNEGTQAVTNFVVTNPLPSAVTLSSDAAPGTEVSVDGGKTWGQLGSLKVEAAEGGERAATAADITHVRWTIPSIAPGASGEVQYHGIVR
ncbi:hypothetical protein [Novosphingobium sp.]|uniref:hypothetical protein n=1 Tax=Novosphingobium sp. TaxID=1874826 RepID=UPI00263097D8|nr:hypothetical protein [Novosphingobium sp.]